MRDTHTYDLFLLGACALRHALKCIQMGFCDMEKNMLVLLLLLFLLRFEIDRDRFVHSFVGLFCRSGLFTHMHTHSRLNLLLCLFFLRRRLLAINLKITLNYIVFRLAFLFASSLLFSSCARGLLHLAYMQMFRLRCCYEFACLLHINENQRITQHDLGNTNIFRLFLLRFFSGGFQNGHY